MRNEIPLARGLGSSAAATVAGLVAGNALLGEPLTSRRPAPARDRDRGPSGQRRGRAARRLHGRRARSTAASRRSGSTRRATCERCCSSRTCASRPPTMRAVLPDKVPLEDAVANLTRVAIGVAGMATGRFDLLRVLTVDRLHEPYRAKAFPQLPRLVAAARGAGAIGACLAGPARRSSRSRTRVGRSPGSRRRSGRRRPTRTWPAGSRSSRRGTRARKSSEVAGDVAGRCGRFAAGPARSGAVDSVRTLRRRWATSSRRSARGSPAS